MSEQQQERSQESLRHEYTEVVQNIRHYSSLRFAAFSVFIAIMAGLGIVAFGTGQFGEHAAAMARLAGVFVIAIFWLHEERLTEVYQHFMRTAVALEHRLGYTQWTDRPIGKGHLPNTAVIMRLFYLVLTPLWLYGAFSVSLG